MYLDQGVVEIIFGLTKNYYLAGVLRIVPFAPKSPTEATQAANRLRVVFKV